MTALHPDLNLGRPLEALREAGAAFIPRALNEPFRQQLQREIQEGPFELAHFVLAGDKHVLVYEGQPSTRA